MQKFLYIRILKIQSLSDRILGSFLQYAIFYLFLVQSYYSNLHKEVIQVCRDMVEFDYL